MVFEIRLKAQHDCPFLDFANNFDLPVHSYCSRDYDIIEIPKPIDERDIEIASKYFPNTENWKLIKSKTGVNSYIVLKCLCEQLYEESITTMIERAGGLQEYPIRYIDGFEYHKIRCLNEEMQSRVIERVEKLPYLEIIAIEDIGDYGLFNSQMISAVDILKHLTERQLEILITAYKGGYYQIPRDIRTKDIADEDGISRYGVEKLLRKAENKIISSIMPYLLFNSNK